MGQKRQTRLRTARSGAVRLLKKSKMPVHIENGTKKQENTILQRIVIFFVIFWGMLVVHLQF